LQERSGKSFGFPQVAGTRRNFFWLHAKLQELGGIFFGSMQNCRNAAENLLVPCESHGLSGKSFGFHTKLLGVGGKSFGFPQEN
jgi:hypothetical protein